jgi:hypothetical protein
MMKAAWPEGLIDYILAGRVAIWDGEVLGLIHCDDVVEFGEIVGCDFTCGT